MPIYFIFLSIALYSPCGFLILPIPYLCLTRLTSSLSLTLSLHPSHFVEGEALGALCQTAVSRETVYALIYQICKSDQSNLARLVTIMNGSPEKLMENQMKIKSQMSDGRLKVDDDKIASASSSSVSLSTSSSRRGSFSGKIGGKRVFQWEYDPSDLIKVCSS